MATQNKIDEINALAPDHDLIDREAAAIALDISVRTLDRWHRDGFGPPRIRYSRKIRYRAGAIKAWIRGYELPTTRQF
jgi:hypothetical protein